MSRFNLSDVTIHWSGRDSTTPPGHYIASGVDSLGNLRVWLFKGDKVSVDGYRGNILYPETGFPTACGPTGGYVTSQGDSAAMLAQLAQEGE
ncbi:hypothetical protein AB0C34_16925 [Nocardia sp. NPDC049220]|uniref:hypothetical protein n=1 Tax=Nocardia sp. NPDC049220 TaxID=3155273 RepID=UPI0033C6296F